MNEINRYILVANFNKQSHWIKFGSKVYIVGGNNGDGFEKRLCVVRKRDNRLRASWLSMKDMINFRAAWLPEFIVNVVGGDISCANSKLEIERLANILNSEVMCNE